MGVSGSGKSAVASEVAHQLHAAFLDGDFLHPRRNIEKMASGEPLNDDDRKPWLQAVSYTHLKTRLDLPLYFQTPVIT